MKRVGLLAAAGLILGSALPAAAQQAPPAFTVTFRGEFRMVAGASNNTVDFVNTRADGKGGSEFKDSFHGFSQRLRLWTDVMSGDKHGGMTLGIETGDTYWGTGGGASGNDGNASPGSIQGVSTTSHTARTGNGSGGAFGADGVSVEVKHSYAWFDIPGLDSARVTVGIQNLGFLQQPTEFFSDDIAGIKFDWKADPVTLQLWYGRIGNNEGPRAPSVNAQANDIYTARLFFKPVPDWTISVEGMVWNQQCFANQIVTTPATATTAATTSRTTGGACLKADFGDTAFFGATASGKIGSIGLDAGFVYGQRELPGSADSSKASNPSQNKFKESGWGVNVAATIPINPVTLNVQGWYTSGDKNRAPGDTAFASGGGPFQKTQNGKQLCTNPFGGGCFTGNGAGANGQNNSALITNSDMLPIPDDEGSWYTRPLIAEIFYGMQTIGGPPEGTSANYAQMQGTAGIGASATIAITPSLTLGGGVAFVGASDKSGLFGSSLFEIDGGLFYQMYSNVSLQGVAGVIFPETGDTAWGAALRTRFAF